MLRKASAVLFAIAAFACVSRAADHPDFSGTWKLNIPKSQPGDYGPNKRTDVITQDGSKFTDKVTGSTNMGDDSYTLTFVADGNPVTVAPDSPQSQMGQLNLKKITAEWDGASLALTLESSYQGQVDVTGTNVYTLSADGKTLTMHDHASTSMGDFDTSLVFDKQ